MRPEAICERIARKDTGCLPRLLDLGLTGELQLHVEIPRSDLEISGKIGDGNAGSVYVAHPATSVPYHLINSFCFC